MIKKFTESLKEKWVLLLFSIIIFALVPINFSKPMHLIFDLSLDIIWLWVIYTVLESVIHKSQNKSKSK